MTKNGAQAEHITKVARTQFLAVKEDCGVDRDCVACLEPDVQPPAWLIERAVELFHQWYQTRAAKNRSKQITAVLVPGELFSMNSPAGF
jgi:hypothetical protein